MDLQTDYVPIQWFEWLLGLAVLAAISIVTALWSRIGKQDARFNAFVAAVSDQRGALEKAILAQGTRFDGEMARREERINQQVQQALTLWSTADIANDELRLKAVNERIEGLKTTIEEFVERQEKQHAENRDDMRRMEERINTNLSARRDSIENAMREGFEEVGKIFRGKPR